MKKLEPVRCPWCGEVLKFSQNYIEKKSEKFDMCAYCKNYIRLYRYSSEQFIGVFMFGILSYFVYQLSAGWMIMLLSLLSLLFLFYASSMTYIRGLNPNGYGIEPPEEEILGRADIRWYSANEGGIGFPYLRITNNTIFPVCFVDANGVPVSQTICVRLQKRFVYFWRRTRVCLINEDIWKKDSEGKFPWEKSEKFLIFNRGQKIGEGKIRKICS